MAAPIGTVPSPVPATASLVGNTFVNKYYNVLHQSPNVVYRFYTDRSILSRAEAGASGAVDIVISQAGINQKIMSLDYADFRAEIKTVDSLESLNGSVLVMVTGSLSSHGRPKRNFVQTFFLAPQEVGYFVLNDMFRYLDGEPKPLQPLVPMANGTVEQHPPAPGQGVVDQQPSPKQESREYIDSPFEEVHDQQQAQEPLKDVVPEAEVLGEDVEDMPSPEEGDADASPEEQIIPVSEETNAEEAPKKSYASILRVRSDTSSGSLSAQTTGVKSSPAKSDRHTAPSQATQLAHASATSNLTSDATSSAPEGQEDSNDVELEGDGRSVYIKNLPLNILATALEDEFKRFGTIKPGGVNLRNQRAGVCFAFIEYDEPASAQSAIDASPILIGGRQVYIEEKKPMPMAQRGKQVAPRNREVRRRTGRGPRFQVDELQPSNFSVASSSSSEIEMPRHPHLRSGKGGRIPSSSCHPEGTLVAFWMRVRRLHLLRNDKAARLDWWYPYMSVVASSVGFIGNGRSVEAAGDDACAKLIVMLELQLRRGDPPHHPGCERDDRACLASDGLLYMEKELEEAGQGVVSWQPPVECVVLADVLQGRVVKIGWYEKNKRVWHPVR